MSKDKTVFERKFYYLLREKKSKKLVGGYNYSRGNYEFSYYFLPFTKDRLHAMIANMADLGTKVDDLEVIKVKMDYEQVNTSVTVEKIMYDIERRKIIAALKGEWNDC